MVYHVDEPVCVLVVDQHVVEPEEFFHSQGVIVQARCLL